MKINFFLLKYRKYNLVKESLEIYLLLINNSLLLQQISLVIKYVFIIVNEQGGLVLCFLNIYGFYKLIIFVNRFWLI